MGTPAARTTVSTSAANMAASSEAVTVVESLSTKRVILAVLGGVVISVSTFLLYDTVANALRRRRRKALQLRTSLPSKGAPRLSPGPGVPQPLSSPGVPQKPQKSSRAGSGLNSRGLNSKGEKSKKSREEEEANNSGVVVLDMTSLNENQKLLRTISRSARKAIRATAPPSNKDKKRRGRSEERYHSGQTVSSVQPITVDQQRDRKESTGSQSDGYSVGPPDGKEDGTRDSGSSGSGKGKDLKTGRGGIHSIIRVQSALTLSAIPTQVPHRPEPKGPVRSLSSSNLEIYLMQHTTIPWKLVQDINRFSLECAKRRHAKKKRKEILQQTPRTALK